MANHRKQRIDRRLVDEGLAPSRAQSADLIRRGCVLASGELATKPGATIADDVELALTPGTDTHVSRGSLKLIAALEALPEEKREKINYDAWGNVAPAADITARSLHGGRRPIDIYRRIYTGINGTPMPAFGQALSQEPETAWHLVHYVRSIVEGRHVEGLDDVVADEPPPTVNE